MAKKASEVIYCAYSVGRRLVLPVHEFVLEVTLRFVLSVDKKPIPGKCVPKHGQPRNKVISRDHSVRRLVVEVMDVS